MHSNCPRRQAQGRMREAGQRGGKAVVGVLETTPAPSQSHPQLLIREPGSIPPPSPPPIVPLTDQRKGITFPLGGPALGNKPPLASCWGEDEDSLWDGIRVCGAFVVSVLIAGPSFMIPMSPVYSTQKQRLSVQTKPPSQLGGLQLASWLRVHREQPGIRLCGSIVPSMSRLGTVPLLSSTNGHCSDQASLRRADTRKRGLAISARSRLGCGIALATSSGLKAKLTPRGNSQEKPSDLTWSCEVQQSHACQAYTACLVQRPAMICGGLRRRFHTTLLPKHPHCLPSNRSASKQSSKAKVTLSIAPLPPQRRSVNKLLKTISLGKLEEEPCCPGSPDRTAIPRVMIKEGNLMCPKNATLSALGCLDWPPGAHVSKKGEPRLHLQVVVSSVQGGKPRRLMNGGMCGRLQIEAGSPLSTAQPSSTASPQRTSLLCVVKIIAARSEDCVQVVSDGGTGAALPSPRSFNNNTGSSTPVAAAASRVTQLQPDRLYLYMETPSWAATGAVTALPPVILPVPPNPAHHPVPAATRPVNGNTLCKSGNIAVFGNVVYSGLLNDHLWHLGVPLFTRLVGKSHVRRNKRCVISGHKNKELTGWSSACRCERCDFLLGLGGVALCSTPGPPRSVISTTRSQLHTPNTAPLITAQPWASAACSMPSVPSPHAELHGQLRLPAALRLRDATSLAPVSPCLPLPAREKCEGRKKRMQCQGRAVEKTSFLPACCSEWVIEVAATSRGPWRLAGAGLSPGTAVISLSHNRECSEEVGKRGCSPGESRAPWRALAPSSHLTLLRQNDKSWWQAGDFGCWALLYVASTAFINDAGDTTSSPAKTDTGRGEGPLN
ncbi:hypothetical protein F7725_003006 [Dissostichus mawsoni]|uniref:Uncharacterized protein n=1 Tax=Dissostichus mawsoni TaxID=36200 RepID=A0A7J5YC51_DISMA|nr:hypothetical protein F7725_003006 [Dissostichus mawsoni]